MKMQTVTAKDDTRNNLRTVEKLLTAGIIAGPFFIILSVIHGLLRPGFDFVRHPASLLLVGDLGWIQVMIFVLTGLFFIAGGVGLHRVLISGIGSRFVAPLFIILGIAMATGGIFTPDPSIGFPPGTPTGVPKHMSWHSMVHGFAPVIGFIALVIALIILGRRFGKEGQRGFMWVTIVVALLTFVLTSLPSFTGNFETGEFNFLPLWVGAALGFGYTSIVIAKIKSKLRA